jgi:hypothetical protein
MAQIVVPFESVAQLVCQKKQLHVPKRFVMTRSLRESL